MFPKKEIGIVFDATKFENFPVCMTRIGIDIDSLRVAHGATRVVHDAARMGM